MLIVRPISLQSPNLPRTSSSRPFYGLITDRISRAAEQRAITDATRALSLRNSSSSSATVRPSDLDNGTKNWSGEDPRTGVLTQWEIGPTQEAPATREQPSRSYNSKLVRSNGAASYEESASGTPATGPSRRGKISCRGRSRTLANVAKASKTTGGATTLLRILLNFG